MAIELHDDKDARRSGDRRGKVCPEGIHFQMCLTFSEEERFFKASLEVPLLAMCRTERRLQCVTLHYSFSKVHVVVVVVHIR